MAICGDLVVLNAAVVEMDARLLGTGNLAAGTV